MVLFLKAIAYLSLF